MGRGSYALQDGNLDTQRLWTRPEQYRRPHLHFESRFESGNLKRAARLGETTYDLELSEDINTMGNTQWFYFAVDNMQAGVEYQFCIVNLLKAESLYNDGMQPITYSTIAKETNGTGWVRAGENVCYFHNHLRISGKTLVNRTKSDAASNFYRTLSFHYTCKHDGDTVYFAHCYPYTYTRLQKELDRLEHGENGVKILRSELCVTIAGNRVEVLFVCDPDVDAAALETRPSMLLVARVHPGETQGSFMVKGAMEFLIGDDEDARYLRSQYKIYIIS